MPVGAPRPAATSTWTRAAILAGATLAALSASRCYRPNIIDGSFACGPGNACPDGFGCAADGRCYRDPSMVTVTPPPQDAGLEAKMDMKMSMVEAGGGEPICGAPVMPLCQDEPAAGQACSPACQRGCDCGRCNVVDGKPACVPAGTVKLGDVCTAGAADNCAPGLICLLEACGNGLARCYKHCTPTGNQCDGTACTIPIYDSQNKDTGFLTCDVPPRACDPVAGMGCPDPALNCYLTSENVTLCDCPRTSSPPGMNNAPCMFYSDCAEGFVCIKGIAGQPEAHCHFVCDVSKNGCPSNGDGGVQQCIPMGAGGKFGVCSP
jgi:hypothetical protein